MSRELTSHDLHVACALCTARYYAEGAKWFGPHFADPAACCAQCNADAMKLLLVDAPPSERLRCDAQGFHDIILRQELTIRELREDKKRLDWLEAQGNGDPWVARESTTGRGWRLANSHATPNYTTAREALDAARRDSGEGEE